MGYDATSGQEIVQDYPFNFKPKFFWLNGKAQKSWKNGQRNDPFQNFERWDRSLAALRAVRRLALPKPT